MHGSISWLLFDLLYFWQKIRIVIENLKVFCIINIVTFWTLQDQHQEPSELKSKTHNWKWCLFRWNLKAFELSFTYIHHSLASLSILFKQKSLSFVNLEVFLHHISMFSFDTSLYFAQLPETNLEGACTLEQNWHQ